MEKIEEEQKKKQQGIKRKRPAKKEQGPIVIGDHMVCSYSGRVIERAIIVPGLPDFVFANMPCAFAFLENKFGESSEKTNEFKRAVCDAYEQPIESVARAPDQKLLEDFGGNLGYVEWMGALKFWDVLTATKGSTVKMMQQAKNASKRGAPKQKASKPDKVSFESAMYVVQTKGVKQVDALDGHVEKGAKETLTPVKAMRKLSSFTEKNKDIAWARKAVAGSNFSGFVMQAPESTDPAAIQKQHNHVATQLTGEMCYGPAVIFFTRKTAVKI